MSTAFVEQAVERANDWWVDFGFKVSPSGTESSSSSHSLKDHRNVLLYSTVGLALAVTATAMCWRSFTRRRRRRQEQAEVEKWRKLEADRWDKIKQGAYKDPSLQQHIDQCVKQKKKLTKVGDPEANRKQKLKDIKKKQLTEKTIRMGVGVEGMSANDILQARNKLRPSSTRKNGT